MNALAISKPQIKAIHVLKSRAKMDDDTYRDFLFREAGVRSSKQLTRGLAIKVIDGLKRLSSPVQNGVNPHSKWGPPQSRRQALDGPFASKLRALWISAWHVGLIADRRDSALLAFVKRQTGIDHTRWLRDPADAARAIEGLKAWLAREADVRWEDAPDDPKACVIEAQLRLLGPRVPNVLDPDAHSLMAELGALIRNAAGR